MSSIMSGDLTIHENEVNIDRIVSILFIPDRKVVNVMELCDHYFEVALTKEQLNLIIQKLQEFESKMK